MRSSQQWLASMAICRLVTSCASPPTSSLCEIGGVDRSRHAIHGGAVDSSYLRVSPTIASGLVGLVGRADSSIRSLCSGILVAPGWVLTAAHCLPQEGPGHVPVGIVGGAGSTMLGAPIQKVTHPSLDAALVRFDPTTSSATFLPLAEESPSAFRGQLAEIAGFGRTDTGDAGVLRFAVVRLGDISDRAILTKSVARSGACVGDSGGPLLIRDSNGQVAVLGILSQGSAACNQSDEFLRSDVLLPWVKAVVGDRIPLAGGESCDPAQIVGRCYGRTAVWCGRNGAVVGQRCETGLSCGWDLLERGFRCVASDPCGGLDDRGTCQDGRYIATCTDGILVREDCGREQLKCAEVAVGARCVVGDKTAATEGCGPPERIVTQ